MISVEEARARILGHAAPERDRDRLPGPGLGPGAGRPVEARRTQPPGDVSAMDGYALRAGDAGPLDA